MEAPCKGAVTQHADRFAAFRKDTGKDSVDELADFVVIFDTHRNGELGVSDNQVLLFPIRMTFGTAARKVAQVLERKAHQVWTLDKNIRDAGKTVVFDAAQPRIKVNIA